MLRAEAFELGDLTGDSVSRLQPCLTNGPAHLKTVKVSSCEAVSRSEDDQS